MFDCVYYLLINCFRPCQVAETSGWQTKIFTLAWPKKVYSFESRSVGHDAISYPLGARPIFRDELKDLNPLSKGGWMRVHNEIYGECIIY